jgi:succinoglycan biosynthesis transport protein ExoP
VDQRRQLQILRSRWPFLIIGVVVAAAIAFGVTSLTPQVYEARATLIVGQSLSSVNPDYNQLLASQRLSATYASLATQRTVLDVVIKALNLDTSPDALAGRVHADASQTTAFLTIVVQDRDPAAAAAIANAVAGRIIAASPTVSGQSSDLLAPATQELDAIRSDMDATRADIAKLQAVQKPTDQQLAQIQTLEDRLTSLRSTYATLLASSSAAASNLVTLIDPAVPPTSPAGPSRLLTTLLAALVGLFAAAAVIFLVEYFDESLKSPEDVTAAIGLPTLGSVQRMKGDRGRKASDRLVTALSPRSRAAEAYRSIRTSIEFASVDGPVRVLLVASATAGEGKTVTAANLAVAFAQAERRVLLVDADLRQPGIDVMFNAPNSIGLTTLLMGGGMTPETSSLPTEEANLRILTTGPLPPNPAELLGSQRMATVLKQLAAAYDLVILDSSPLQAVTDSAILSSRVDGTLLVVDATSSRRQAVTRARDTLERAGARTLGVVLNRVARHVEAEQYSAYGVGTAPLLDPASTSKAP